jgi:hypothetical protein
MGSTERIRASPRVDGQSWRLRTSRSARGDICLSQDVPGELVGTGCISSDKVFARGPLYAIPGARQIPSDRPKTEWDNMWVYGVAHRSVARLELVNMDCSREKLPLDGDGVFNHVVGRAQVAAGMTPYKLIATDLQGHVIAERTVAIGLSHNAKTAGREVPRPAAACS